MSTQSEWQGGTTNNDRARDDAALIRQLLDMLPIYATRIGFRYNSTPEEAALGGALFDVHEKWQEVKP